MQAGRLRKGASVYHPSGGPWRELQPLSAPCRRGRSSNSTLNCTRPTTSQYRESNAEKIDDHRVRSQTSSKAMTAAAAATPARMPPTTRAFRAKRASF